MGKGSLSVLTPSLPASLCPRSQGLAPSDPAAPCPSARPTLRHSPPEQGLLQALAGGQGLPGEHVAHDDTQAAGHEGQHGLGLECAAAGHQAQAL